MRATVFRATMTSAETRPIAPPLTLAVDRSRARAQAEDLDERARMSLARSFGYHVVAAWWSTLDGVAESPLREPLEPLRPARLNRAMSVLAHKIGSSLRPVDVESAAYHVGLTYIGMLSPSYRAANGVYYTPPVLGARLMQQATAAGVDWRTARVLDPACGGGAFLAPVARRMTEAMTSCEPRIVLQNVAQRLRGYEIDPFAAWLSQVTLDAVLVSVSRACGRRLPNVVTVCDSLSVSRPSVR